MTTTVANMANLSGSDLRSADDRAWASLIAESDATPASPVANCVRPSDWDWAGLIKEAMQDDAKRPLAGFASNAHERVQRLGASGIAASLIVLEAIALPWNTLVRPLLRAFEPQPAVAIAGISYDSSGVAYWSGPGLPSLMLGRELELANNPGHGSVLAAMAIAAAILVAVIIAKSEAGPPLVSLVSLMIGHLAEAASGAIANLGDLVQTALHTISR